MIASTVTSGTLKASGWDYSERISEETELRVRAHGSIAKSIHWSSGLVSPAFEISKLGWNPSGTQLAVLSGGGGVTILSWPGFQRKDLTNGVASLEWLDDTNLVCVLRGGGGAIARVKVPVDGTAPTMLTSPHPIPATVSHYRLAPSGDRLVAWQGSEVAVVDMAGNNRYSPWLTPIAFVLDVFWSKSGAQCLVIASGEKTNTTDVLAEPHRVVLFFDGKTGEQLDLTEQLRKGAPGMDLLFSQSADEVWGTDGDWFVVKTIPNGPNPDFKQAKDWLCRVSPWAMLCIQKELRADFHFPKPFPRGNRLGIVKPAAFADHGLFVTELVDDSDGKPHLNRARRVHGTSGGVGVSWRWSDDGTAILTFAGDEPVWHPVPPAD